jgi:hypothetical protein
MADSEWQIANGEWQMANGGWRMADGNSQSAIRYSLSATRKLQPQLLQNLCGVRAGRNGRRLNRGLGTAEARRGRGLHDTLYTDEVAARLVVRMLWRFIPI